MFLEVGSSGLGAGSDGRAVAFVDVSGGTCLVDVGAVFVEGGNEESYSVGTSDVGLGRPLMAIGQIVHQASAGDGGTVDVLVIQAFVSHPFGKSSGVGGEACDADAEVVVNFENLLLVCG